MRMAFLVNRVQTEVDEAARVLRVRRGDLELIADFANVTVEVGPVV